jgi:hypothetical protein
MSNDPLKAVSLVKRLMQNVHTGQPALCVVFLPAD